MAHSLISAGLLKIISNRRAENAKRPGKPPFPNFQRHFQEMDADPMVGNDDRLVGVLSQAQMRCLPSPLIKSSQPNRLASLAASTVPNGVSWMGAKRQN
jgi:hypothetical protein